MRLIASVLVALAGCIAEEPLDVEASTQNLRTGVSDEGEVLVGADVLVTDASGAAVPCGVGKLSVDLSVSFDDGASFEVVPSDSFHVACADKGTDLAVVLDNSASLDDDLPLLRTAAMEAVDHILDDGGRVSLVRVSTEASVLSPLTNDRAELQASVDGLRKTSGWTALYDGVRMANETLGGALVKANEADRYHSAASFCAASDKMGILLFTDGQENNSSHQMLWSDDHPGDGYDTQFDDLLNLRVRGVTTPVYAVTLSDKVRAADMTGLASETGGRHQRIKSLEQLSSVFGTISDYTGSTHQICGAIESSRCGPAILRVTHRWKHRGETIEGTREQIVNIPCGVREPSRVVTILLSMSNPGIPREVAGKLAAQALEWASPVDHPRVLVVRDDNHHDEFAEDPLYVRDVLAELGYDVDFVDEPASGLTAKMLKGYDAVWFSNPGYPMDSESSKLVLLDFSASGGGVVMQGDDMAQSWGLSFDVEPLTHLTYVDNGTSYCGVNIDNNRGQSYLVEIAGEGHPVVAGLTGVTFEYGDDIDASMPRGEGVDVLAWATVSGLADCEPKPVIVAFTP
ncbi:MAG: VWA domain-containing protein [Polyangiales bacterium]